MSKQARIARARYSALGRVLCKIAGDKTGAVMMEYVILAVLIAAACVVAVAMFGKTIVGMFDVAAAGATGEHTAAAQLREDTVAEQDAAAQAAHEYHEDMHE